MAKPLKNTKKPVVNSPSSGLNDRPFPVSLKRFQIALAILTFLCYANTLGHGFVLDDGVVITKNIYTQQGIRGIPDLISHDTFQGFFKGEQKNLVSGGRYRPFSLVLFAIENSLFGQTTWLYHLVHILIYILTALLIFHCVLKLLSNLFSLEQTKWVAAFTAILFAIHPIHTEVVANLKSIDEILSLGLSLAAIYLLWEPNAPIKTKIVSGILFTLALFSKENAILWIPLGILVFYFLSKKSWSEALIKTFPLFLPALLFITVRYMVLHPGSTEPPPIEWLNNPFLKIIQNKYTYCTDSEKWGSIMYSLFYYLRLTIWPYPLTHDYYPNHFPLRSMNDPMVIVSSVLLLSSAVAAWAYRKKNPLFSFCILFFFGSLILVANIFFPVGILFSERFAFTASFGYCLWLGWLLHQGWKVNNQLIKVLTYVLILLAIAFTIYRNRAWKSNYILFKTDVEHSPSSAKINNALGGELLTLSESVKDSLEKTKYYEQADRYLKKAISIHPLYVEAWLLQGNSLFYQKKYDESIAAFQRCLAISPGYENSITNLHVAYREGGKYWGEKMHRVDKALTYLQEAFKLKPDDFETLRLLGVAYGVNQDNVKAIDFLEKALIIRPQNASVLYNLGSAYLNSGNPSKGQEYYDRAKLVDSTLFNK